MKFVLAFSAWLMTGISMAYAGATIFGPGHDPGWLVTYCFAGATALLWLAALVLYLERLERRGRNPEDLFATEGKAS